MANWKSRGLKVALKSLKAGITLDERVAKEFVKEVCLTLFNVDVIYYILFTNICTVYFIYFLQLEHLRKVNYHENINRILGVTKGILF